MSCVAFRCFRVCFREQRQLSDARRTSWQAAATKRWAGQPRFSFLFAGGRGAETYRARLLDAVGHMGPTAPPAAEALQLQPPAQPVLGSQSWAASLGQPKTALGPEPEPESEPSYRQEQPAPAPLAPSTVAAQQQSRVAGDGAHKPDLPSRSAEKSGRSPRRQRKQRKATLDTTSPASMRKKIVPSATPVEPCTARALPEPAAGLDTPIRKLLVLF